MRRPEAVWIAWQGPVAYHVHSGSFVCEVISTGVDQVRPLSSEYIENTLLVSIDVLLCMSFSWSAPRFHVERRMIRPVSFTKTGHGLPHTLSLSSHTVMISPHVLPPSVERFSTRSMSPVSLLLNFLASANARIEPSAASTSAGILYVSKPFSPLLKTMVPKFWAEAVAMDSVAANVSRRFLIISVSKM